MHKIIKYIIASTVVLFSSFLQALEVGDIVSNTASINYSIYSMNREANSNTVEYTIEATEAKIEFLYSTQAGTQTAILGTSAYQDENGVWHEGQTSTLADGTVLGNDGNLYLEDAEFYRPVDTPIIRVEDADQNIDRDVRDVIEVTVTSENGDIEVLRLIETTNDSGVFVGYIVLSEEQVGTHNNRLYVNLNENIVVGYEDNAEIIKSDSAIIIEQKDFKVWVEKRVDKPESSVGELLFYTLTLHNDEEIAITDFVITDALPLGLKYEEGTATYAKKKVKPILSKDGKSLKFSVLRVEPHQTVEVTFIASVTAGVEDAKVVNEAWITKNTIFKSNVAKAITKIREELMRSKGIILGKIHDEQNSTLGIANVRVYLENGMYVVSDQNGKYHFSGIDAGRHIIQVDKGLLPQGYEMATCKENSRGAGKNFSEFLNLGRGALKRVNFCLKRNNESLETKEIAISTLANEELKMPTYGLTDLNKGSSRAILWPPKKYVPSMPSTRIAIKAPKAETIVVWLNDVKVSKINYDGKTSLKKSSNFIDLYKGVDLLTRTNIIKVEYFSNSGKLLETLRRKIHVSSVPVQVKYIKEKSVTIANGQDSPVLAVRFLDEAGQPLRAGMTGTFSVEAPYASEVSADELSNNPLTMAMTESRYIVASDGIAYIRLQPTTQSGEVSLHFQLQERDEVVRAWLKPALREWIMVGFAEGTVGYNKLKGHNESLGKIGAKEKVITEGRVSFFAKGRIKGDWLLSMAYDTGKDTSKKEFFDEIDPNAYYTLYNDNSIQDQEAPSREKLYIKLEKEQFNILFGDYSTDLSYTELSAYSRRFTGIKSEFHSEYLTAKVFASHTEQLFVKDEIRGDGTSGYYYLKSKAMIPFSEKIIIEVRNRYRQQEIVSTKSLQRFRDYEINYALGRIYFKEPVYSNDEKFNPRFIVVDYEVNGEGGKHYTYGGRAAVKALTEKVEVGATYISEDSVNKESKLLGVDATIELGGATRLKAEYAKTKNVESALSLEGEAKLAEIEHVSNGIYARAYYREQDDAFGLGQLTESLGATRKVGLDLSKQFENRQTTRVSMYRESDLLSNTDADVLDFRMELNNLEWSAFAGYRYSKLSSEDALAQQLLLGGSYALFNQRLRLSLLREQTVSEHESELFPTKTTLGLDYTLTSAIDLFSTYEWSNDLEQGRAGVRVRPWTGMIVENTMLSEFFNDQQNLYNTLGGMQTFQLNDNLAFNAGYEKGEAIGTRVENNLSTVLASDAFSAYRLGVNYTGKSYTTMLNGEFRQADKEERINLSTAVYTQTSDDLALALSASLNRDKNEESERSDTNIRLSVAYRPEEDEMIMLEKLDLTSTKVNDVSGDFITQKIVNNLNVNLMPNSKSELALQHGFKYVTNTINDYEKKGVTQLIGLDGRYDITSSWELGMQGSMLYAQSANNMDYGFGLYSGHNLFDNMVLTLGYNWKGFEDQDFSLQTYRMEGPYFRFNMKFDQENLKDTVRLMSW
jgi:uncharacterized repeat protein (TIGR01451 family)